MSVFDVFNNGTVTFIRCNATRDGLGAPKAAYFNDDGTVNGANVLAADLACQIEYHRNKLLGNETMAWEQPIVRTQRDIWLTGVFDYLNGTGGTFNGVGVKFASTSAGSGFGRILDIEVDGELLSQPTSIMLTVEVIAS